MEKHKEAEAQIPAKEAQIPAEEAQVPAKDALVPAEKALVPAEKALVPAKDAQVPAKEALVPAEMLAEEPLVAKLTMPEADRVEFKSKTDPYGSPMGGDNSCF